MLETASIICIALLAVSLFILLVAIAIMMVRK